MTRGILKKETTMAHAFPNISNDLSFLTGLAVDKIVMLALPMIGTPLLWGVPSPQIPRAVTPWTSVLSLCAISHNAFH